jgi:hypothetical protein
VDVNVFPDPDVAGGHADHLAVFPHILPLSDRHDGKFVPEFDGVPQYNRKPPIPARDTNGGARGDFGQSHGNRILRVQHHGLVSFFHLISPLHATQTVKGFAGSEP